MTPEGEYDGLPRLAYVGDVPVESSYHGSALVYRLLQGYPPERLLIVEVGLDSSLPTRRLPGVDYLAMLSALKRLQLTRFVQQYDALRIMAAPFRGRQIATRLRSFAPTALLTVSHGTGWITAAHAASSLGIPLHLICHDEWAQLPNRLIGLASKEELFGRVYRSARSQLCVSPFMVENYEERFGKKGTLLYPARSLEAKQYSKPPDKPDRASAKLVGAFAGTINSPGYVVAIGMVAEKLARLNGELHIFGPMDPKMGEAVGLSQPNIRFRGSLPSEQLIETLRADIDFLFAPMSFDPGDRINMELSFPSKLTDYTLTGLPILIFGPEYCSAVRWAKTHDGVAQVVTDERGKGLDEALCRLSNVDTRRSFGATAAEVGVRLFSYITAKSILYKALLSAVDSPKNSNN